jgi:DNA adenine methylase
MIEFVYPTIVKELSDSPFEDEQIELELGAFGSPGGKSHIVLKLLKLVPKHDTYIEPFVGGAALYWKKEPVNLEVLNDLDEEIAHAYKFIRGLDEETIEKVKSLDWKGDKSKFFKIRDSPIPKDDLDRFYKFFYVHFHSYGASRKTYGYKKLEPKCFDKYLGFSKRMQNTKIFNDDYGKVIKKFDSPNTFIYLDPPYPNEWPGHTGTKAWGEKQVNELHAVLSACKGKWLLSINNLDWIRKIFNDFNVHKIMVPRKFKGAAKGGLAEKYELLISNYEIRDLDKSVEDLAVKELSVVKRGGKWCVVHGHPMKPGSKTDKPIGSIIKCFPGTSEGKARAIAMHRAIIISEAKRKNMSTTFPGIVVKNAKTIWEGNKEPIFLNEDIELGKNLYFMDNNYCYGILKLKNVIKGNNGNLYDFDIIDKFEDAKPIEPNKDKTFIEDTKFMEENSNNDIHLELNAPENIYQKI